MAKVTSILLVLALAHIVLLVNSEQVKLQTLPVESSPGVLFEVEDGQLWYEGTAPIVYTVKVPTWLNFLVLPEKLENCSCSSATQQDSTSSCTVLCSFEKIAGEIQASLRSGPATLLGSETGKSTWGLKCNHLGKHFSSSLITPEVQEKYMRFLRSCSKGHILEEPTISDEFLSKPIVGLFQDLEKAWNDEFFSRMNNTSPDLVLSIEAMKTGQLESILSLGVSNFISEALRWNTAFSKCSTGHIPDTLIDPERFHTSLLTLNQSITASGNKLVIPPEKQFLPVYFKSEHLTDCAVVVKENNDELELTIRVLVPIIKTSSDWKHLTIKTLPFINKYPDYYEIQYLHVHSIRYPSETASSTFLFSNATKTLFTLDNAYCDTTKPGFCKVPPLWDTRRHADAVSLSYCLIEFLSHPYLPEWTCREGFHWYDENTERTQREFKSLPVIVSEGSHTFYIAGVRARDAEQDYDVVVKCNNNNEAWIGHYLYPNAGTLKLKLGCGCHIEILGENEIVIEPEHDLGCNEETTAAIVEKRGL